jgi:hypothetical protein
MTRALAAYEPGGSALGTLALQTEALIARPAGLAAIGTLAVVVLLFALAFGGSRAF